MGPNIGLFLVRHQSTFVRHQCCLANIGAARSIFNNWCWEDLLKWYESTPRAPLHRLALNKKPSIAAHSWSMAGPVCNASRNCRFWQKKSQRLPDEPAYGKLRCLQMARHQITSEAGGVWTRRKKKYCTACHLRARFFPVRKLTLLLYPSKHRSDGLCDPRCSMWVWGQYWPNILGGEKR